MARRTSTIAKNFIAWNPDSTGSLSARVKVANVSPTGLPLWRYNVSTFGSNTGMWARLTLSPNYRYLATPRYTSSTSDGFTVKDLRTTNTVSLGTNDITDYKISGYICGTAWALDSSYIILSHSNAGIKVKNIPSMTDGTPPVIDRFTQGEFSPDGNFFAITRGADGYLKVYETSGWTDVMTYNVAIGQIVGSNLPRSSFAWAPDSSKLYALANGTAQGDVISGYHDWDTATWTRTGHPNVFGGGSTNQTYSIALSPDGTKIAGTTTLGPGPRVWVLNTSDDSVDATFMNEIIVARYSQFSQDGRYLVVCWNFTSGMVIIDLDNNYVNKTFITCRSIQLIPKFQKI